MPPKPNPPAGRRAKAVAQKVEQAEKKMAEKKLTPKDEVAATDTGPRIEDDLVALWARVEKLMKEYEKRLRDVETREAALVQQREALEHDKSEFVKTEADVRSRVDEVARREKAVASLEDKHAQEERRLAELRLEADAGFATANREAIAQLEEVRHTVLTELQAATERYLTDQTALLDATRTSAAEARDKLTDELRQREQELDALAADVHKREGEVGRRERIIALREGDLVEDRSLIERLAAERAQELEASLNARVEALTHQVSALSVQLGDAIRDREELRRASMDFEGRSPQEVRQEIALLQRRVNDLEEELAARPSSASADRIAELDRERAELHQTVFGLKARSSELERRLTLTSMGVNDLELARDRADLLESINAGYKAEIDEARRLWGELTEARSEKSPFPAMSAMAVDEELLQTSVRTRDVTSLHDFIESLRHRMALAIEGRELYYEPADIRTFLGGLAAARMHLLQGISGTGKTSLPLAFAAAVGGGAEVIEVQAGWRDRQDLIGFYNAFEQRFDERPFVQAVFKAGMPSYADRPFFIVLDEMNLSYPEQYFADLLSLLERDSDQLRLVNAPIDVDLPNFDGMQLHVPRNLWFIGTANRDETTVAFADKTYDRAHVMELPERPKSFRPEPRADSAPVSLSSMRRLFASAADVRKAETEQSMAYLDGAIAPMLSKLFGVGWSHRLRRIAGVFVPVVVEAGGSVAEATDHLLATKVLRKVQDRFDVATEDYQSLLDHLFETWEKSFGDSELPVKSERIIDTERRRRA